MAVKLCPDRLRAGIAIISACCVLAVSSGLMQIGVIIAGGAAGYFLIMRQQGEASAVKRFSVRSGALYLALFFSLLVLLPFAASYSDLHSVRLADSFYRGGLTGFRRRPCCSAAYSGGGYCGRLAGKG
ncbi:MAG: hypothetical protein LRY51_03665 [Geovibrio sp.]|nr:hypothetical protein [Geovibrio sp.]